MTTIRTAVLEHVGELDFRSITGTGRTIDFGEVEQGFLSPVETVLVALGACTAMDVISTPPLMPRSFMASRTRGCLTWSTVRASSVLE